MYIDPQRNSLSVRPKSMVFGSAVMARFRNLHPHVLGCNFEPYMIKQHSAESAHEPHYYYSILSPL